MYMLTNRINFRDEITVLKHYGTIAKLRRCPSVNENIAIWAVVASETVACLMSNSDRHMSIIYD